MPIRTVVLVFLCIVAAVFLILNWPGITAPVPVNLLYTDTEAPLGLILLLVLGVLWIAGIIWALLQQAATLLEIRKAYKEADSSRGLADSAEKSRSCNQIIIVHTLSKSTRSPRKTAWNLNPRLPLRKRLRAASSVFSVTAKRNRPNPSWPLKRHR